MRIEEKKRANIVETDKETAKTSGAKNEVYIRKLTPEELQDKYILILNTELDHFPPIGHPFTIRAEEQNFRVAIKEVMVSNAGPAKVKRIIEAPKLFVTQKFKLGDKIVLSKKGDKIYRLRKI